ncbi:MAG TPA: glycosyltransferase family 2 protein [Elusimicrobia bacterium]|nr:glycosyltransferase family 2 protein [Elusimicrobiota bacterium]HBT62862.1 glycosyltransferase family 2 protein [Elusimicrobiota bacterium]
MPEPKIAIFIPAYNAAYTLPVVLDRIPPEIKAKVKQIFVVDNASPDNTYLIGIGYREAKGLDKLEVFRNETNRGYGGSQKLAYRYAVDHGFDIVVMLHGDAQYAPEKIPYLLEPLERGEADMVFGSRIAGLPLKGGMPLHKFLGNKFLTAIQNQILGMRLTEFHSGFRVFSCAALAQVPFELCSNDYHFDTDIIIQFKIKNLRIREMPIPTYYGKEKSGVNVISYGMNVLKSMLTYWLWSRGLLRVEKFDRCRQAAFGT